VGIAADRTGASCVARKWKKPLNEAAKCVIADE
jgi:hypothetical protein